MLAVQLCRVAMLKATPVSGRSAKSSAMAPRVASTRSAGVASQFLQPILRLSRSEVLCCLVPGPCKRGVRKYHDVFYHLGYPKRMKTLGPCDI